MNKIKALLNKIDEAKELIQQSNSEIESIVAPLLKEAGIADISRDRLDNVYFDGNLLRVAVSWATRGCESSADYELPLSILNAPDPMAEAKKYREEAAKQATIDKERKIKNEIERLQKQLERQTNEH